MVRQALKSQLTTFTTLKYMPNVCPIEAVVFDAFGTTIRYGGKRHSPYKLLLEQAASKSKNSLEKIDLLTTNQSIQDYAYELGDPTVLETILPLLTEELEGLRLYPEVENVLSTLQAKGIKIAVCSNLAHAYGASVRKLLPQMQAYIFSYEVQAAKPNPSIFNAVCTALHVSPETIFFTGDSMRCDVEGPKNYGMQSAWLNRRSSMTLLDVIPKHLLD